MEIQSCKFDGNKNERAHCKYTFIIIKCITTIKGKAKAQADPATRTTGIIDATAAASPSTRSQGPTKGRGRMGAIG